MRSGLLGRKLVVTQSEGDLYVRLHASSAAGDPGGRPAPRLVRHRLCRRVPGAVPRRLGTRPSARCLLPRLLRRHDRPRRDLCPGRAGRRGRDLPQRWRWSLGLGVVLAAFLVFNVFNTEDATARPHGAYFLFELLWRGVGYGLIDTLLLTIFPCFVAYKLLHGHVDGLKGKLRFTALTLPLVLIITATYHWGYPQYREDGLSRPETGNVLISIPTFATANPVGSVVAHVSQHVAAVTHAYESRIFNPPETKS